MDEPTAPAPRLGGHTAPARRPGGRTADVRRRVVTATRDLLVEHGFDALGIDAVAERCGVHRTTVYRRWRDVGGLLADVLAEAAGDDWAPPDTGSLAGDLAAVNRELHLALTAGPPLTAALIAASFRSARAAEALRAFWDDRYARCAVIVERAVHRAEISVRTDARRLLVAATAPLYHELLLMRAPFTAEEAEAAALDTAAAARAGAYSRPAG